MLSVDWMRPSAPGGTSSGEISVARMSWRTCAVSASTSPERRDKADQMLDQGLGDRRIGVVMRHLIADPVGAPAETELGEVAGADHQPAIVVRQPEQVIGAQSGLDILVGHVVHGLAGRRGVPDVLSICRAAGRMSISAPVTPSAFIKRHALALVVVARCKARESVGEHVAARHPQPVHDPRRDDQCLGRVRARRKRR